MTDEETQSNSTNSESTDSTPPPPPPPDDDFQISALVKGQKNASKGIQFFDFNIKEDE